MYELHCPNCGWSTILTEEQIRAALAEAERLQATHYVEQCQRCQWVIRTAVSGLRVVLPAEPVAEQEATPAALKTKSAPGKASARKPVTRKPAAKKPAAKKPAAKKPAAKKATIKKPPSTKKAATKKPAAKKSPTKNKS